MVKMPNRQVYVIDDEFEVRLTLENIFRFSGFRVKTFSSAKEALNNNLDEVNSCIILDFNMPEIGGLQFQDLLKDKGIKIPIIFYSGKADVNSAVMAMTDGAFTVVQKPASNHFLIEQVDKAINNFNQADKHHSQCLSAKHNIEKLSNREFEIAKHFANGCSAIEVAEKLFISRRTAEAHKVSIFNKLKIKSVATLAQIVLLANMIDE
jgi:FixJ family two-component response regulator